MRICNNNNNKKGLLSGTLSQAKSKPQCTVLREEAMGGWVLKALNRGIHNHINKALFSGTLSQAKSKAQHTCQRRKQLVIR